MAIRRHTQVLFIFCLLKVPKNRDFKMELRESNSCPKAHRQRLLPSQAVFEISTAADSQATESGSFIVLFPPQSFGGKGPHKVDAGYRNCEQSGRRAALRQLLISIIVVSFKIYGLDTVD